MGVGKPGDFPKSCPPPPPPLTANICLHNVLLWGKAKEQLGRKCPGMLHPDPNSRAAQLPLPTGHKALRPSPTFPPFATSSRKARRPPMPLRANPTTLHFSLCMQHHPALITLSASQEFRQGMSWLELGNALTSAWDAWWELSRASGSPFPRNTYRDI